MRRPWRRRRRERRYDLSPPFPPSTPSLQVPPLDLVVKFFDNAFSKSQMESECIIMALIYIERLIKVTKGRFCIRYDNWRPTVFACMILASKVWDDLSMWNVDFSQISPAFDLQRINELELALLEALHYEVKVPAGEYAKYYFHLRSMIARLGFYEKHSLLPGRILPLSVEGARKLQLATENYEEQKLNQTETRPRCVSIHTETPAKIQLQRMQSTGDATDLQRTVAVGMSSPSPVPCAPPHLCRSAGAANPPAAHPRRRWLRDQSTDWATYLGPLWVEEITGLICLSSPPSPPLVCCTVQDDVNIPPPLLPSLSSAPPPPSLSPLPSDHEIVY
jgi:hypothetical protein